MNVTALCMATLFAAAVIAIEHLLRRLFHWEPPARYNYVLGVATVLIIVGTIYGTISDAWQLVFGSWLLFGPAFVVSGILIFVLYGQAENDELKRQNAKLQAKIDVLEGNK